MTRRARQSGVTLLELLIAVTLVSMLSVAILYAMRVGLLALEKVNNRLQSNRRVVGVERVLEQQIAGLIPVPIQCMPAPEQPASAAFGFFQGDIQTMRFVSSYSLNEATRGYPQALEYSVIPMPDGRGVRLIVNEFPYTGPRSIGPLCIGLQPDPVTGQPVGRFRPVEPNPNSFVLADKLAYCRFSYQERMPLPSPVPEIWGPRWVKIQKWPSAIRIDLAPLQPDSGALQVMSLVSPVRVTRDPLRKYETY